MTPNLFIRGNREPRAQLVGKKGLATGDTFRKLLMGDADISEIIIVNQHIFDWMIDKLNRKTFIEILKESKRRFPERKIKLLLRNPDFSDYKYQFNKYMATRDFKSLSKIPGVEISFNDKLHSKYALFKRGNDNLDVYFIGSSNLSRSGMGTDKQIEFNLQGTHPSIIKRVEEDFEKICASANTKSFEEWVQGRKIPIYLLCSKQFNSCSNQLSDDVWKKEKRIKSIRIGEMNSKRKRLQLEDEISNLQKEYYKYFDEIDERNIKNITCLKCNIDLYPKKNPPDEGRLGIYGPINHSYAEFNQVYRGDQLLNNLRNFFIQTDPSKVEYIEIHIASFSYDSKFFNFIESFLRDEKIILNIFSNKKNLRTLQNNYSKFENVKIFEFQLAQNHSKVVAVEKKFLSGEEGHNKNFFWAVGSSNYTELGMTDINLNISGKTKSEWETVYDFIYDQSPLQRE